MQHYPEPVGDAASGSGHLPSGAAAPRPDPTLDAPARLAALANTGLTEASDPALEPFARLVRILLEVPVALVSLVTPRHQFFPGMRGLAEPWASKRETPLSHSFCQYVVRRGEPFVVNDVATEPLTHGNLAIDDLAVQAYTGMPLTDQDGNVLGSLCAIDHRPRRWTSEQLAALADLAAACSSELRLRIALAGAERARQRSDQASATLTMLNRITELLVSTMDIEEALRRLATALVPRLADWCLVNMVDEDGGLRQMASAHRDPALAGQMRVFSQRHRTAVNDNSYTVQVSRTGRPVRVTEPAADIRHRANDPELAALAERLGYRSVLCVPLVGRAQTQPHGVLTLVNGPQRPPFTEADQAVAVEIAHRAGLALGNTQRYGEQRHAAEVLQRSLHTRLPEYAGITLAARYLPAAHEVEVGGDWYDAFQQPDGSLVVAIGDVAGHNVDAAAVMGQLRNLLRGNAWGRAQAPHQLLSHLDRSINGLGIDTLATATLVQVVPRRTGRHAVRWANAGHPPPLLRRADGQVEILERRAEPLLGFSQQTRRHSHDTQLRSGDLLVLYTDGLVERRGAGNGIDSGLAALIQRLSTREDGGLERLCDRLLELLPGHPQDDVAVLLLQAD